MTSFISSLTIAFIITGLLMAFVHYKRQRKIIAIKRDSIVIINSTKDDSNTFIFNKYAIPVQINHSDIVEVVIPDLDDNGELQYHICSYDLSQISIPKYSEHKKILEFIAINELKKYIKEDIKTGKEIFRLREQRSKIRDLAKLIWKSDVHSNQIETFDRALSEINELINKAKQLEKLYINLVKESLIGVKIQKYNPDLLESNSIVYETKYKQLKEEYFYMKDTAKAYEDLMRKYHR
jgi:hypothetical protein